MSHAAIPSDPTGASLIFPPTHVAYALTWAAHVHSPLGRYEVEFYYGDADGGQDVMESVAVHTPTVDYMLDASGDGTVELSWHKGQDCRRFSRRVSDIPAALALIFPLDDATLGQVWSEAMQAIALPI